MSKVSSSLIQYLNGELGLGFFFFFFFFFKIMYFGLNPYWSLNRAEGLPPTEQEVGDLLSPVGLLRLSLFLSSLRRLESWPGLLVVSRQIVVLQNTLRCLAPPQRPFPLLRQPRRSLIFSFLVSFLIITTLLRGHSPVRSPSGGAPDFFLTALLL